MKYSEIEIFHILYLSIKEVYEELIERYMKDSDALICMLLFKEYPVTDHELFTVSRYDRELKFIYSCFRVQEDKNSDVLTYGIHISVKDDPSFDEIIALTDEKQEEIQDILRSSLSHFKYSCIREIDGFIKET